VAPAECVVIDYPLEISWTDCRWKVPSQDLEVVLGRVGGPKLIDDDGCVLQPHEVHDGTLKGKRHVQWTTQMARSTVIMAEEKSRNQQEITVRLLRRTIRWRQHTQGSAGHEARDGGEACPGASIFEIRTSVNMDCHELHGGLTYHSLAKAMEPVIQWAYL